MRALVIVRMENLDAELASRSVHENSQNFVVGFPVRTARLISFIQ